MKKISPTVLWDMIPPEGIDITVLAHKLGVTRSGAIARIDACEEAGYLLAQEGTYVYRFGIAGVTRWEE